MKVLVTGGTGFTGKALVRRLIDGGHQVVAMDHLGETGPTEHPGELARVTTENPSHVLGREIGQPACDLPVWQLSHADLICGWELGGFHTSLHVFEVLLLVSEVSANRGLCPIRPDQSQPTREGIRETWVVRQIAVERALLNPSGRV